MTSAAHMPHSPSEVAPGSGSGSEQSGDETIARIARLEERLGVLEDEARVLDRLYAYAHAIDVGDVDALVDCFAPEGTFESLPRGLEHDAAERFRVRCHGHEEIRAFMAGHTRPPAVRHRHVVAVARVIVRGTTATSASYLFRLDTAGSEPYISVFGEYSDELVRYQGDWRFLRRLAAVDSVSRNRQRAGGM